jgi:hypothetical protein
VREFTYFNDDPLQTEVWRNSAGGRQHPELDYNENGQALTISELAALHLLGRVEPDRSRALTVLDPNELLWAARIQARLVRVLAT